ncbi:MAG: UDP binding domain-containing protein, partial [Planctomycetota bacterium]
PVVERLRVAGMEICVGHDATNVGTADLVAISTAIPEHNPEVRAAKALGDALERANVVVVLVDHDEFRNIERSRMSTKVVVDTRGVL